MTHTWRIIDLKRTNPEGVVNNVVYECHTEDNNIHVSQVGDLVISGSSSDEGFIPYQDLTENTVLGWVTSSISDYNSIETGNSASIAQIILDESAKEELNGLPW